MRPRIAPLTDAERAFLRRYEDLHAQWLVAEEAAAKAEAAILAAVAAHQAHAGLAPSADRWDAALRLRAMAEHALGHALQAVRSWPL